MRCYICDTYIEEPQLDPRDKKVMPCGECQSVIEETLYEDNDEDGDYGFIIE